MALLIHDGYILKASIPTIGGTLNFNYRPALADRVWEYQQAPRATAKEFQTAIVKLIVDQLVSWDVQDKQADGSIATATIDAKTVARLPLPAQLAIIEYLTGYAIGDSEADAKN